MADRSQNSNESLPSTSASQATSSATSSSAQVWRERLARSTEFVPKRREHDVNSPRTFQSGYVVIPVVYERPSEAALRLLNASGGQTMQKPAVSHQQPKPDYMQNQHMELMYPQLQYNQVQGTFLQQVPDNSIPNQYMPVQAQPIPPMQYPLPQVQHLQMQYPHVQQPPMQYPHMQQPQAQCLPIQYSPMQYPQVQQPQMQYPQVQHLQMQDLQVQQPPMQYPQLPLSQAQHSALQYSPMQVPPVQTAPIQELPVQQPVQMTQSHSDQEPHLPEKCKEVETHGTDMPDVKKQMEKVQHTEDKESEKTQRHELQPKEVKSVGLQKKVVTESEERTLKKEEKAPEKAAPVARKDAMKSLLRQNIQAQTTRHPTQEHGRETGSPKMSAPQKGNKNIEAQRPPARAPPTQKSSIKVAEAPKELDLDALFIGSETANLPGVGQVSRTDFEKNKEAFTRIVLEHQRTVLDDIEDKSTREERFVAVPKKKSVDSKRYSEKTQKAVQAAVHQARREKAASSEVKAAGSKGGVAPGSSLRELQRDEVQSDKPCTSALRATSSGTSGETTLKTTKIPKKSKKGGNKKGAADEDDDWFGEAAEYNIISALDTYYKWRTRVHRANMKIPTLENETDDYQLEKRLIMNSRTLLGSSPGVDSSIKTEFITEFTDKLPTLRVTEEQRATLTKFFSVLFKRNDETFVLDCSVLNASLKTSEAEAASTLTLYHRVCMNHASLIASLKSSKPSERRAFHRKATKNVEAVEVEVDLVAKFEKYIQFRRQLQTIKWTPPPTIEQTKDTPYTNAFFTAANDHSGEFKEEDTKFKNVFCNHAIRIVPTLLNLSAAERKKLTQFFTFLLGRTDDIVLVDIRVVHEYCSKFPQNRYLYLWWFYQMSVESSL